MAYDDTHVIAFFLLKMSTIIFANDVARDNDNDIFLLWKVHTNECYITTIYVIWLEYLCNF